MYQKYFDSYDIGVDKLKRVNRVSARFSFLITAAICLVGCVAGAISFVQAVLFFFFFTIVLYAILRFGWFRQITSGPAGPALAVNKPKFPRGLSKDAFNPIRCDNHKTNWRHRDLAFEVYRTCKPKR